MAAPSIHAISAVGTVMKQVGVAVGWLFDSRKGLTGHLIARWLFLRSLALVYLSAFCSLIFQIRGLIGPSGILPAKSYLAAVAHSFPASSRYWYAPTLLWFSAGSPMLMAVTWIGLVAALCAFLNLWPRLSLAICFLCFLSFVAAASDFSGYQSDGMLLEAGFLAIFFSPRGFLPGWGVKDSSSPAAYFLLLWEWFRIYFESGMVKILSGDPQWRNFTAMDNYYQNAPLPTWIGWYAGHAPHWMHVASAALTLLLEFGIVLFLFLPRRARLICFWIVTAWQTGVILTGNYAFLNYLVLFLGILLLDDRFLERFVPAGIRPSPGAASTASSFPDVSRPHLRRHLSSLRLAVSAVMLTWIGYATTAEMIGMVVRPSPLPGAPVQLLAPFRVANRYGLFAVMTRGRYEIEFQGSNDRRMWTAYRFRYKPQAINEAPGIYAPYQPRFEWNLWFASLGDWRQNQLVPFTEERLLANDEAVLQLFRGNPFPQTQPRYVRAVLWQYWFPSLEDKRRTGEWWRREMLGRYTPTLTLAEDGQVEAVDDPDPLPQHD